MFTRTIFILALATAPIQIEAKQGYFDLNLLSTSKMSIDENGQHMKNNYVSAAPISKRHIVISNYSNLMLLDRNSNEICVLKALDESGKQLTASLTPDPHSFISEKKYNPTGVFYGKNKKIFVANYKGNNILIGSIDLKNCIFQLENSIHSQDSLGPENVYYDNDTVYSANYDAGTVTAHRYSDGTHLWSASVPQAHGVSISKGKVYATGLTERKIYEINKDNGRILRSKGSIGWDPMSNQYMWPTSIQPISDTELIVSDAQTGYVSIIDRNTLSPKSYLGGNGMSSKLFNYPYAAIPFESELIILSSMRGEIFFLKSPTLISSTKIAFDTSGWPIEKATPFGAGWTDYTDRRSPPISISGKQYHLGFGNLQPTSSGAIFKIPDTGGLFNPEQYMYFLQGAQLGKVALFFSSSSTTLLIAIQEERKPTLLFSEKINIDSWLSSGEIVSRQAGRESLHTISAKAQKKAASYYEHLNNHGWVDKETLYRFLEESGGSDFKSFLSRLDMAFSSSSGRRFKLAYDQCDDACDLEDLKIAAQNYFLEIQGLAYIAMDEYLLVGMLTGIIDSERTSLSETSYNNCDSGRFYEGYGLEALSTETLNDYLSAVDLASSSVCWSAPEQPTLGLDIVWNDIATAPKSFEIYGRASVSAPWLSLGKFSDFAIDSSDGFARSKIIFDKEYYHQEYRLVILDGGTLNRLALRKLKPIKAPSTKPSTPLNTEYDILECSNSGLGFYPGFGLESLRTPSLSDYLSAIDLQSSSICISIEHPEKISGFRFGWPSAEDIGNYINIYGSQTKDFLKSDFLGKFPVKPYQISDYNFSDIKIENLKSYPYYKISLASGKGQNRLILNHLSPLKRGEHNFFNPLSNSAKKTSLILKYGTGVSRVPQETSKNLSAVAKYIRSAPSAHCGNYALLFIADLPWFLDWTAYDLQSYDGRIHTVVETNSILGTHVYDPTLGIGYACSLTTMINGKCNYSLSSNYQDAHPALLDFRGAGFFYGAKITRTYKNQVDLISPYFQF